MNHPFVVQKLRNLLYYDISSIYDRPFVYGLLVLLKDHLPDDEYLDLFTLYLLSRHDPPEDSAFYSTVLNYIQKYA